MDQFYIDNTNFIRFNLEHRLAFLLFLIFTIYFVYQGVKKWENNQKRKYAIILASFAIFTQLFKALIRVPLGNFDASTDLPLHLCNLMPFVMLYVFIKGNRDIFAIFFFWIMAGTFQALFTPTLKNAFPHYESIRYWVVHGGLVALCFYGFYAYKWRFTYKDVIKSVAVMNITALFIYPINVFLGANYFFLNGKPEGKNLYSLLPEWPTYILCLEGVLVLLFSLVFIIFKGLEFWADGKIAVYTD
jgi:hypothetical integral membrane protein (TIGR02206 family)